ncbi:MAG: hypothetical protein ACRCTZ_05540 [Sarcina sp.]
MDKEYLNGFVGNNYIKKENQLGNHFVVLLHITGVMDDGYLAVAMKTYTIANSIETEANLSAKSARITVFNDTVMTEFSHESLLGNSLYEKITKERYDEVINGFADSLAQLDKIVIDTIVKYSLV